MKKNNKGFTLAELLIVVAIIAVLVAIAIPVFTKRLEASRETTDIANLRSAYAAAEVAVLAGQTDITATTMAFDPNAATGLAASGSGAKLGKGTATEGGADVSNLPSVITYTNATPASGKEIQITFDATGTAAGEVKAISFAS